MLKVGMQKDFSRWGIWMLPLKVGKCRITIRYKLKGKTYSMSQIMTIKAYPSPIAWIKVNGKKVDLKKNKFQFYSKKLQKGDLQHQLQAQPGLEAGVQSLPRGLLDRR